MLTRCWRARTILAVTPMRSATSVAAAALALWGTACTAADDAPMPRTAVQRPAADNAAARTCTSGSVVRFVRMTNLPNQPVVRLKVGEAVRLVASNDFGNVTAPRATGSAVCRASVTTKAPRREAVFVGVRRGSSFISATIRDVPGGLMHPAFGVRLVVT
jgi:hypothetical protein